MKTRYHGQMSESFLTAVFLSLSGGQQDAYTNLFRGKVFANAQTGNIVLRSGMESLCRWRRTHDPKARDRMLRYFGIILLFAVGAGMGDLTSAHLAGKAIWVSCGLLLVAFVLMFIREDLEENPVIEKDLSEIRAETREIDRALKKELQEEHREWKAGSR